MRRFCGGAAALKNDKRQCSSLRTAMENGSEQFSGYKSGCSNAQFVSEKLL
jgi:hypothetical protein